VVCASIERQEDIVNATGDLTEALRGLVFQRSNAELFGVAPVERLHHAPAGSRPADYLPQARCVVVLGEAIPRTVVDVAGHYDEPGKTLGPYMWYGYAMLNWDLSATAMKVAKLLEARGFRALPFPPTGLLYKFGERADFSHRHAAVAAGLGEFGTSGLLLTPEFGPRQRLVSIITDAPLEPSPMYDGPKVCRPEVCGKACVAACPTGALTQTVSVNIGERNIEYAKAHPVKCRWPFPENGFRRTKVAMPHNPTSEDLEAAVSANPLHPYDAELGRQTFVPQCGACIFACPAPRFTDL
jgi:epoxyqueuosine reductase